MATKLYKLMWVIACVIFIAIDLHFHHFKVTSLALPVVVATILLGSRAGYFIAVIIPAIRFIIRVHDTEFSVEYFFATLSYIFSLSILVYFLTSYHIAKKRVKTLEGLIHICSSCKKINDENTWQAIESYIADHSGAEFTHGICPPCIEKLYGKEMLIKILRNVEGRKNGMV